MNVLPGFGNYLQPPAYSLPGLPPSLAGSAQGHALSPSPFSPDVDPVVLSDAGKALAQQAAGDASSLLRRAADLGSAASDAAKKLVVGIAESLFGDDAKGMSVSFDAASVSASSSFSATLQHVQDRQGSADAASWVQADASDFVGKGTITTADGHRFSFEVQVHYEARLEVSASSSTTTGASVPASLPARLKAPVPDQQHLMATSQDGLAARFPGSVADLFKLFGPGALNLPFQLPAKDGQDASSGLGSITLRLLEKLDNPDSMLRKLAKSYGDAPASGELTAQG